MLSKKNQCFLFLHSGLWTVFSVQFSQTSSNGTWFNKKCVSKQTGKSASEYAIPNPEIEHTIFTVIVIFKVNIWFKYFATYENWYNFFLLQLALVHPLVRSPSSCAEHQLLRFHSTFVMIKSALFNKACTVVMSRFCYIHSLLVVY